MDGAEQIRKVTPDHEGSKKNNRCLVLLDKAFKIDLDVETFVRPLLGRKSVLLLRDLQPSMTKKLDYVSQMWQVVKPNFDILSPIR